MFDQIPDGDAAKLGSLHFASAWTRLRLCARPSR